MWKSVMGLVGLALAGSAWAGTPIDEHRPLDADGKVSVSNIAGLIDVVAWDRSEVSITGELGKDAEKLDITGDKHALRIKVRYPDRSRNVEDTRLQLKVPRNAVLDLQSVSADVRVEGTNGALSVGTVSGDITARSGKGDVEVNTVSGDTELDAQASRTQLKSVSGDIDARGISGTATVETVSGDLRLTGSAMQSLKLQTVSGDIILDLGLTPDASVKGETLSGDIQLKLGGAPDAKVSMKTFSGDLSNAFEGQSEGDRHGLEVTLGQGRAHIDMHSFSGDIDLDRGH